MAGIIKEITYDIDRNGCFVCTSHALSHRGYPRIKRNKAQYRLHRWIYQKMYGMLPTKTHVHHICQNKTCINFQHLKATTRSKHLQDHARGRCPTGVKLTEKQVIEILNDKIHT